MKKDEFLIQHRDIPEEVQNKLGRAVGDFTVPIVLDWEFLGSGTLIAFGNTRGILTAEHVVQHPKEKKKRIDTSINSTQPLFTTVAEFPHELTRIGQAEILTSPLFQNRFCARAFLSHCQRHHKRESRHHASGCRIWRDRLYC